MKKNRTGSRTLMPGERLPTVGAAARIERVAFSAFRSALDLAAILGGFVIAYELYVMAIGVGLLDRGVPAVLPYLRLAGFFAVISLVVFWQFELYEQRASVLNLWELQTAVKGLAFAAAVFFALIFLLKVEHHSRIVVGGGISVATALVLLERRLVARVLRELQVRGRFGRRVLIYGCGETGRLLMKKIVQAPHVGRTVIGFIDDETPPGEIITCRVTQTNLDTFQAPVLGHPDALPDIVDQYEVDELLVAVQQMKDRSLREILQLCRRLDLRFGIVPHVGDFRADLVEVQDLSAIPVLRPRTMTSRRGYETVKRIFDVSAALVLLAVTAPLWALAALAIRIESGAPVLFRQERVGLHGRRFVMLKFRTMHASTRAYAPAPRNTDDPRITRVGRILRLAGFDELPQLLNVIRGEMSLVGPRPEMPFIVARYSPLQRMRLLAKPGLTGVWQLSADRQFEIHDNIEYDLYYLSHRSLILDLLLLSETTIFAISVGLNSLRRLRRSVDRRSAAENREGGRQPSLAHFHSMPGKNYATTFGSPVEHVAAGSNGGEVHCVLVALDQRRTSGPPSSWRACLPAAYAISERWPVKILVAPGNAPRVDSILRRTAVRRRGRSGVQYVAYRSRGDLRTLALSARLIITDLSHVQRWGLEANIDVVSVGNGGARWVHRSARGREIVEELSRWLSTDPRTGGGTAAN